MSTSSGSNNLGRRETRKGIYVVYYLYPQLNLFYCYRYYLIIFKILYTKTVSTSSSSTILGGERRGRESMLCIIISSTQSILLLLILLNTIQCTQEGCFDLCVPSFLNSHNFQHISIRNNCYGITVNMLIVEFKTNPMSTRFHSLGSLTYFGNCQSSLLFKTWIEDIYPA